MFDFTAMSPANIAATVFSVYFILLTCIILSVMMYIKRRSKIIYIKTNLIVGSDIILNPIEKAENAVYMAIKNFEKSRNTGLQFQVYRLAKEAGIDLEIKILIYFYSLYFIVSTLLLYVFISSSLFIIIGVIAVTGFPYVLLTGIAKRRRRRFSYDFGTALDLISRGLRSGLSVISSFGLVSQEGPPAVKVEFLKLLNDMELGLSLSQAVHRLSERVNSPEVRFFSVAISVQAASGGNISAALENLSSFLRERKRIKGKIEALSAEAKTSAWIVGALPVLVFVAVNFLSPQYTNVLFNTKTGQLIMAAAIIWAGLGAFVMSKMTDLEA